jgi:DNA-binding winged helix-turn-helix (wHTH) protein
VSLVTLCFVVIGLVRADFRQELEALNLKLSDLGQEVAKLDGEIGALARQGYELEAKVADHLLSHARPQAKAAPKPATKKAPAKKATPAKKASARAR